jgi:hypothetical protein
MTRTFKAKDLERLAYISEGQSVLGFKLIRKNNFSYMKTEPEGYCQMVFEYDSKVWGVEFYLDWDKVVHWDVDESDVEVREMLETRLTITNYEYK